jgi:hypothetical protein
MPQPDPPVKRIPHGALAGWLAWGVRRPQMPILAGCNRTEGGEAQDEREAEGLRTDGEVAESQGGIPFMGMPDLPTHRPMNGSFCNRLLGSLLNSTEAPGVRAHRARERPVFFEFDRCGATPVNDLMAALIDRIL